MPDTLHLPWLDAPLTPHPDEDGTLWFELTPICRALYSERTDNTARSVSPKNLMVFRLAGRATPSVMVTLAGALEAINGMRGEIARTVRSKALDHAARLMLSQAGLAAPAPLHAAPLAAPAPLPAAPSVRAAQRLELVREDVVPRKRPLSRGKHPALLLELGHSPPNGSAPNPSASLEAMLLPCEASSGHDVDHTLDEAMSLAKKLAKDIRNGAVPAFPVGAWHIRSRVAAHKWLRRLNAEPDAGAPGERVLRLTLLVPETDAASPAWARHSLAWWRFKEGAWMISRNSAPGVKRARLTPPAPKRQEQANEQPDDIDDSSDE